jgi:hypothetical protein
VSRVGLSGVVSSSIRQPLALRAKQSVRCRANVVGAKSHAVVMVKIELCQIAMKVLFANVVVDAGHAALRD